MLVENCKTEIALLTHIKSQPCVSVIMPFEPKMISKTDVKHALKIAADKIKRDLKKNYTEDLSEEVYKKLENVIAHLDYTTHKKSVAIYVSPEVEKVFYLNIPVKEKIMVDNSFEIKDIVLNKKEEVTFLLLTISGKRERIFFVHNGKLQLIAVNYSENVGRDMPSAVANFTDASSLKETRLKNFLRYIDQQLAHFISLYNLPLFVIASKKTIGYFQAITKHQKHITAFVHGNFDDATDYELLKALQPQIANWKTVKQQHILNRLKLARDEQRVITGIHDVWKSASRKHDQFLVVEKQFTCNAFVTEDGQTIFSNSDQKNTLIANDAVDDIIEQVLERGGDVEFVDELKDFKKIALIEKNYYETF